VRIVRLPLACLLVVGLTPSVRAAAQTLRLADDRGQAVNEALSVCFQVGTAPQCTDVKPGETVPVPPSFSSVRAEGAHHGPISARPRELTAEGGQQVLRVPRKALLHVDHLPADPLTLSAFRSRAESFRNPIFYGTVGADGVEIPAGDLVLELAAPRGAPDLQRLSAAPGAQVAVSYHPRTGWSLLVRCTAAAGGAPVADATVSLAAQSATTGADGLALLPGLQAVESLKVRHARYIAQEIPAPPATVGAFLVHEVVLEQGGSVAAHVTLNDQPAVGTRCTVLAAQSGDDGEAAKVAEGVVGAGGIFRSRLPAGSYTLRVSVVAGGAFLDQPFDVREGDEAQVEVALRPVHVTGRVLRSGMPAVGYTIVAEAEGQDTSGTRPPALQSLTDDNGLYQATAFVPGDYFFQVRSDIGIPLGEKRRVRLTQPEETVDFDLSGIAVTGRVMDEEGNPVEGVDATLRAPGGELSAMTSKDGLFQILVPPGGSGELSVRKLGYDSPPSQTVSIGPGQVELVTFVLKRR